MRTTTFTIACLAAVSLVSEAQAGLAFLETPYEFLDKVVMTFYKPLVWYAIISPMKSLACGTILTIITDMFVTNDTYTDAEKETLCHSGIEMYWEQFFYGGPIGNQPYDLAWAWTPSR